MWRWLLIGCVGCSTLAEAGGGDQNLPNAGIGPFREIKNEELGEGRAAPYALRDDDDFPRDPAFVAAGDLEIWAYVAHTVFAEEEEPDASAPPNEIIRQIALDGRSFARQSEVVLAAEADWEMGTVASPAALRIGGEIFLYYAAAGGIGLATSSDGTSFTRVGDGPVLAPVDGWEQLLSPRSPMVLALPDGHFRMYYEVALPTGSAVGEARSRDGVSWLRVGDAPLLAPRAGELDEGGVAAPYALLVSSAEGRDIELLYYAATDGEGGRAIALVARHGTEGAWSYATAPVFGTTGSFLPTEPAVLSFDGYRLLFVTQKAGTTEAQDYPAVAIGVAPADATLPPPNPP